MYSQDASRILIVDDNARNVAILKKILGKEHVLATAGSGEEALTVAADFSPDLVLLDIMMPGIDGYETCRRFRDRQDLSHTKIIMVSAKAAVSERLEGYQAGADDYVTKPFDEDELKAKIQVYLKLKSVEEVDRLKSDLLSLLNHETRTPLTFLLAPAEMLLNDPHATGEQRELLQMILDGAQRLHALLGRVAFLSALKCGHAGFALENQDLRPLLEAQVRAVEQSAGGGVSVRCELPEAPMAALVDGAKIATVVRSILENAIRFSPPGAAVVLTAAADDEAIEWSVRDHGEGIAPAFLPRVFDEFAVQDVKHHNAGHGLSLATARLIVRRHGGTIQAQNEPDGGATFRVRLPRLVPVEASAH